MKFDYSMLDEISDETPAAIADDMREIRVEYTAVKTLSADFSRCTSLSNVVDVLQAALDDSAPENSHTGHTLNSLTDNAMIICDEMGIEYDDDEIEYYEE